MNLIKGLLGFGGSPLDKLIDSTKAKGGFYRVINGSREVEIESCSIEFQRVKDHPEYKFVVHIKSLEKGDSQEHAIPIHEDMDLKVFYRKRNNEPKLCYEWVLVKEKSGKQQYVGIIVDRGYETELSDAFGHLIKEIVDKDSKESHLSYLEKVGLPPVHNKQESSISNSSSNISSTSKITNASKAERLEELNDVLIREATAEQTVKAYTGRLNHIVNQQVNQINPSIVFAIKQKSQFNYSIYIYTSKGFKLQEKPISHQASFSPNIPQSSIQWFDCSQNPKIVQVVFDKYDVVQDVYFTIERCKYQTSHLKRFSDDIKEEDQQYIKDIFEEKNYLTNPKIVEVYEKQEKIDFAPKEPKNIIKNSKQVIEKYKDKKTMVQGKTADFTIVSLANMLDVLTIDQDKNLKKVETIELKDKSGEKIVPEKMLMHDADSKILIQNEGHSLCYFDLNEQKLVEEFRIGSDQKINDIVAEKKLAELDKFNTFIGVSSNGIYRIDPRIPKTGLAEKHIYKGDNYQFDKVVTTSDGNYAIGSLDGTIRLYNNKINNKTKACNKFPYVEKVVHLDTTKDGKWILATFPHQLILLPTFMEDDVDLYETTVPIRERQRPKKLKINRDHLKFCKSQNPHLVPARFDQNSTGSETLIISGFQDYIAIWSFDGILKGYYDYKFCKAEDLVNNVEFKFNDPSSFFTNTHSSISMQKTLKK